MRDEIYSKFTTGLVEFETLVDPIENIDIKQLQMLESMNIPFNLIFGQECYTFCDERYYKNQFKRDRTIKYGILQQKTLLSINSVFNVNFDVLKKYVDNAERFLYYNIENKNRLEGDEAKFIFNMKVPLIGQIIGKHNYTNYNICFIIRYDDKGKEKINLYLSSVIKLRKIKYKSYSKFEQSNLMALKLVNSI